MTYSVPGILISRDGTVREYMGHSKRTGTLLGRVEKHSRTRWTVVCEACFLMHGANTRNGVVRWLRDHWANGPSMSVSHVWKRP